MTSGAVSDVLRRNGLKPHLVRTYKVSRDPEFAAEVRDLMGIYLNPPTDAVVLSVDAKMSIQALECTSASSVGLPQCWSCPHRAASFTA